MAGFYATDYFIRQAEMMQSTMTDEEIAYQLSLLYLPVSTKRADRASSSSSSASASASSSRGRRSDRITEAEEQFLCAFGINNAVKYETSWCASCGMSKSRSALLSTKNCMHEFCTDCLRTHAEGTLSLTRAAKIECPHPSCTRTFDSVQCKQLLSKASFEALSIRETVATIPGAQRVRCPFSDCSASIPIYRPDLGSPDYCNFVECHSCRRRLCLQCNVPWEKECDICTDMVPHTDFISTNDCVHKYCTACCRQHAEVRILSGSAQVDCPDPDCTHAFHISQCTTLLSASNFDILDTRLTEAAIPAAHKVFCPYQGCSFLMEKSEEGGDPFAVCYACQRGFCLECKVPWHGSFGSCAEYRAHAANAKHGGDQKLKDLAKKENWQVCPDCAVVVELKSGCYHITCRCGTEFCYLCQKKWVKKKPTCKCKIWDERNIINQ